MCGRMIVPQSRRPEGYDCGIAVENTIFSLTVGIIRGGIGVIRVEMSAMNCVGNSGSPWRGGTCNNQTDQAW